MYFILKLEVPEKVYRELISSISNTTLKYETEIRKKVKSLCDSVI